MSLGYLKRELPVLRAVSTNTCAVKDAIDANEEIAVHSRNAVLMWRGLMSAVTLVVPFIILGISAVNLSLKGYNYVPWLLVGVVLSISVFHWLRMMLSMNLFVRGRRRRVRFYAIGFNIVAALYYLAGSFAIRVGVVNS